MIQEVGAPTQEQKQIAGIVLVWHQPPLAEGEEPQPVPSAREITMTGRYGHVGRLFRDFKLGNFKVDEFAGLIDEKFPSRIYAVIKGNGKRREMFYPIEMRDQVASYLKEKKQR